MNTIAETDKTRLPARLRAPSATTIAATEIAAAEAAASAAAEATSATSAIFARFGFVNFQRATTYFLAIELFNSRSGFFLRGHFDEGEPARTSCITIFDNTGRFDCAGLGKQLLQVLAGSLESEVSNIEFG